MMNTAQKALFIIIWVFNALILYAIAAKDSSEVAVAMLIAALIIALQTYIMYYMYGDMNNTDNKIHNIIVNVGYVMNLVATIIAFVGFYKSIDYHYFEPYMMCSIYIMINCTVMVTYPIIHRKQMVIMILSFIHLIFMAISLFIIRHHLTNNYYTLMILSIILIISIPCFVLFVSLLYKSLPLYNFLLISLFYSGATILTKYSINTPAPLCVLLITYSVFSILIPQIAITENHYVLPICNLSKYMVLLHNDLIITFITDMGDIYNYEETRQAVDSMYSSIFIISLCGSLMYIVRFSCNPILPGFSEQFNKAKKYQVFVTAIDLFISMISVMVAFIYTEESNFIRLFMYNLMLLLPYNISIYNHFNNEHSRAVF